MKRKPIECEVKTIVQKDKSGNWEVLWNGNWIASFKYDHDAYSFVETKTFMVWTLMDQLKHAS